MSRLNDNLLKGIDPYGLANLKVNRNGAQGARGDSPVRTVTAEDFVGWRRGFGEESQYTPCGSLAEGTSIRV